MHDFITQQNKAGYVFGNYSHFLGSYEYPSKAANLIKNKAENGDGAYQYLWGLANVAFYPKPLIDKSGYSQRQNQNEKIVKEGLRWLFASADQGYVSPMLFLIRRAINSSTATFSDAQHDKLSMYASILMRNKEPGAAELTKKLEATLNFEEEAKVYDFEKMLLNYRDLSVAEIFSLIKALRTGEYLSPTNLFVSLEVKKDLAKQKSLLRHLVGHPESNGRAAYELSKLQEKENTSFAKRDTRILREIALTKIYPPALRDEGYRLGCSEKTTEAKNILAEAAELGDTDAADYLEELEEYGNLYGCTSNEEN
jgi:TPR repeat protein